ncbi:MAG: outer membrane beta-barrel protein [Deltaproteobacteria bacterium]|jgi:opacity protein-like surface antigen|nr:outer membrane beta-barrel protein [Deltaproteobacteria bacterium]MCW8893517.1 outer membrane beta-barrel protein [Deltaproteobacteria bacterium]MCW9049586.1 outer membrane beta-barrel protein [Deltaproteobacteria bacterium]
MKKSVLVLAAVLIVSMGLVTPSSAEPYLSINTGAVWAKDSNLSVQGYDSPGEHSYDIGYVTMSVAIGKTYTNGIRAELEIPYRFNDIDEFSMENLSPQEFDREISLLALMTNIYYDFDTGSSLKPFVGGGIGYGLMQIEGLHDHRDAGVFAYQLMIGCGYALSKKLTFDLQYRAFATENPEFTNPEPNVGKITIESEYMTHNLMLGLRYYY